jgi:hypothetical protein
MCLYLISAVSHHFTSQIFKGWSRSNIQVLKLGTSLLLFFKSTLAWVIIKMWLIFVIKIWNWLVALLQVNISLSNHQDVIDLCKRGWSSQCKFLILVAIINCFNLTLVCRNQLRFKNKIIDWKTVIYLCDYIQYFLLDIHTSMYSGPAIKKLYSKSFHCTKSSS